MLNELAGIKTDAPVVTKYHSAALKPENSAYKLSEDEMLAFANAVTFRSVLERDCLFTQLIIRFVSSFRQLNPPPPQDSRDI